MSALFHAAIYVNASSERLRAASRGGEASSVITEKKRWVTGYKLLLQARDRGEELPLIFAQYAPLTFWAVARDITIGESTTDYRFAHLTPLAGRRRSDLVVASSGAPLPDEFIRSYAIVRTPDFLSEAAHNWPNQSLQPTASRRTAKVSDDENTSIRSHARSRSPRLSLFSLDLMRATLTIISACMLLSISGSQAQQPPQAAAPKQSAADYWGACTPAQQTIAVAASMIAGVFGLIFGWWVFPMLIAPLVYFTESELAIWSSRLSTAIGFGIIAAIAALILSVMIFTS
jgi:hypothetical protein